MEVLGSVSDTFANKNKVMSNEEDDYPAPRRGVHSLGTVTYKRYATNPEVSIENS